ncbi:MAG: hydroxyphenylacetyl-CoA thioesterase PaaI [Candidatus Dormibacteraeota bacterium]|nr:hydroxyphenylacetyl-CoA thioesterase PaaI [Candidatus Dormibacteraeota bacterium]
MARARAGDPGKRGRQSTEDPQGLAESSTARMWTSDAASQQLGMKLELVAPGRAVLRMSVTSAMINGHGICHGGYIFTLADSAFACACNTYGETVVAAGADITFISPARLGEELAATASERFRGGRSGLYDVTVVAGTERRLVAEFRGRSRTLPSAPKPALPDRP